VSVIAKTFETAKAENRMAFMPFITAGDPDLDGTKSLIKELAAQDVDLIEIGFPYSDPIADGPVIQESYTRALAAGIQIDDIFTAVKSLDDVPPLVAMVSYALVFRTGLEAFVQKAADAGFAGMIVPDLPGDEAVEFSVVTQQHGLDLVQLVAPTSTPERTTKILETCTGFVYCIAVSGITGERTGVRPELIEHLKSLRQLTDLPLAVGFGISQPEHVDSLRDVADGVIVGSAIVRRLSESESPIEDIGKFAATMVTAVRNG
jgi:tryptophan synthase alpha chain